MNTLGSDAFVFFGATGDLAYKKIFPALYSMLKHGQLELPVIGVAKQGWNVDQLRERCARTRPASRCSRWSTMPVDVGRPSPASVNGRNCGIGDRANRTLAGGMPRRTRTLRPGQRSLPLSSTRSHSWSCAAAEAGRLIPGALRVARPRRRRRPTDVQAPGAAG